MQQVRGHVFTDAATHQLHRAAVGRALALIAHHMQIAHAQGLLEIKASRITHQIQFEAGVTHIAANPTIAASIDAEPFEGPIGLGPQIDAAMGHLHRARQQQSSGHGAA